MTACVLDSAMALAWVLPGEGGAATDTILDRALAVAAIGTGMTVLGSLTPP